MNSLFTKELSLVMEYMIDVLGNEYPTDEFTPEYLIVALLDNKKSTANMILDNCLMSVNIEKLRNIYTTWLEDYKKYNNTIKKTEKKDSKNFNSELNEIITNSEKEKEKLKSERIGSEHILLSMLNPKTECSKIQEVFKVIGLDYNFMFNKWNEKKHSDKDDLIVIKDKKILNNPSSLKGEVNMKAVSSKTEFINLYTTSLNKQYNEGKIDKLIGRTREVETVIKVMARRKKNNVILVGDPGCGKTQIVKGLAEKIVNDDVPQILKGKEIVMLNTTSLVSGTSLRGQFEERVKGLFDELKSSKNHILFIDDIQSVLKSTSREKDTDISPMIGEILSEGDVRVIATTSFKDYRNCVEINTSISRKLQKIVIEPSSINDTIEIIENNKHYYEEYHNVTYSKDVVRRTVELANRYITDRKLPDSAIDLIDLAGAYTCLINREPIEIVEKRKELVSLEKECTRQLNEGNFEIVEDINDKINNINKILADFKRDSNKDKNSTKIEITNENIASSLSDLTNIPLTKLTLDEKHKIAKIDDILKQTIIGQDEAVASVCRVIKRNKIGLGDKNKVSGTFLLLGKSGTGKTLLAKQLAKEIFGSERDLVRIDMSEYSEKASVSKLIGASSGYVGFENGGQLTEAIKNKPHCVLLLDEIEKANDEVYNLFLQMFDEGRLTDNSGQVINFKNVIILMTSNIGAREASEMGKGLGFVENEEVNSKTIIEKRLKRTFSPEFINRIDQIVHFNDLSSDNLKKIVKLELKKFISRLKEINYDFEYDEKTVNYIHEMAVKQKEYGARPIIRLIQDNIEDRITDLILDNEYDENYVFKSTIKNGKLSIK